MAEKRGKTRKNEATIKNEDFGYEQKVTWTFVTNPLLWSSEAHEKILYGGLTSWVRQHIKRELDRQQPLVNVFNRMMPSMKKMNEGEQEVINRFLQLQAAAGFPMQDSLQDTFIIGEDLVIGEAEVEETESEEK